MTAAAVVAYLFFHGTTGSGLFHMSEAGGNAMDGKVGQASAPPLPGIPRIDLEPHPVTETATFAMG